MLICSLSGRAQQLLPKVETYTQSEGYCKAVGWRVEYHHVNADDRQRLDAALPSGKVAGNDRKAKATPLVLSIEGKKKGAGRLVADDTLGLRAAEGYRLTVTPRRVSIQAASGAGLYHGLQTLAQLRGEDGQIPCCTIDDAPRYAWRGLMVDLSRHFLGKEFVERQIDAMARYKMNTLHLHLTDAAGWRLQINRYPELTHKAAWRSAPDWKTWWNGDRQYRVEGDCDAFGGYLTQDDAREIVAYAKARYINVVPEIEMPAHSEEVLAAYPQLACPTAAKGAADFCPGNEATYQFLENVLTEVMEIFPSTYIHVGGDEAGMAEWPKCPLCQQRMREEGMTDVKQLQGYLIRRIGRFLARHGRKLVGWDEILTDSVPTNATAMVWRDVSEAQKAMRRGIPVVLSPGAYCYLDSYQDAPTTQPEAIGGYLPLSRVYGYCPPDGSLVRGLQGNLWTEYVPTPSHAEYMLWPRALAIAEIGWTRKTEKNFDDFRRRALWQTSLLQKDGYHTFDLSREYGNRAESLKPVENDAKGCVVDYNDAPYSNSYPAAGPATLTDGLRGGWHYSDGRWQGFIGKGMDVTVDLGRSCDIASVSLTFMQQMGPEVYLPAYVALSVSDDGKAFAPLDTLHCDAGEADKPICYKDFVWRPNRAARYVRLTAKSGKRDGWLFTDEIVVKTVR